MYAVLYGLCCSLFYSIHCTVRSPLHNFVCHIVHSTVTPSHSLLYAIHYIFHTSSFCTLGCTVPISYHLIIYAVLYIPSSTPLHSVGKLYIFSLMYALLYILHLILPHCVHCIVHSLFHILSVALYVPISTPPLPAH